MCTAVNGIYATGSGASLVPEVSGLIAQLTPVLEGHRSKPRRRRLIFLGLIMQFQNLHSPLSGSFLNSKLKLFFLKMCRHARIT